jgi:hypothetical protein
MGICPKCVAAAVALGAGVLPMFCNHVYGDAHLPERAIHSPLTEPVVAAITTTSEAMAGLAVSSSLAVGMLTATSSTARL